MEKLELMAATRSYDLGLYVQPGEINKQLIYLFRDGSKNFTSTFDSKKNAAEAALIEIDEAFAKAAAQW